MRKLGAATISKSKSDCVIRESSVSHSELTLNTITGWLDRTNHELSVRLSRPEMSILYVLMSGAPSGVSVDYLSLVMSSVQRNRISLKTVSTYIVFLRKKLTMLGLPEVIFAERPGLYRLHIGLYETRAHTTSEKSLAA